MIKRGSGVTLAEVCIAITCSVIIIFAFNTLLRVWTTWSVLGMNGGRAMMEAQSVARQVERDFNMACEISESSATSVGFIMDISKRPGFNRNGDPDLDFVPNFRDPDIDNDANTLPAAGNAWRHGFNLKDDDDDGDGRLDFQVRYFLQGNQLMRDHCVNYVNSSSWGNNITRVGKFIKSVSFKYYGTKGLPMGANLDTGLDGNPSTSDTGNNDGVIDQIEIDKTTGAYGGPGNNNGKIDTLSERVAITSILITIEFDVNQDNKEDYVYKTEISPPLMSVRPYQL